MSGTPEYRSWRHMWARCTDKSNKDYWRYKDRAPPQAWRNFSVFYAELGPRPTPKHSLERIKNELPYGPGNCRWATASEQNFNSDNSVKVVVGDEILTIASACKKLGLNSSKVYGRWLRHGDMAYATDGKARLLNPNSKPRVNKLSST